MVRGAVACASQVEIQKSILVKTEASHAYRAGDEKETKRTFLRNKVKSQLNVQVCIITMDGAESRRLESRSAKHQRAPQPDILSIDAAPSKNTHVDMFSALFFIQTADWM